MLCAGDVAVEFLIEHHRELFGEEVAELASALSNESPAPGVEAETAEVCQVHTQCDNKSALLQKVELLLQGQTPACSSAEVQSKAYMD